MSETFILIPGRTSDQGCGISEGKFLEKYQREINTLQVAPGDMERLGLANGDRVRLTSDERQVAGVVIDEALELAKTFGGQNSVAFVNGILDRLIPAEKRVVRLEIAAMNSSMAIDQNPSLGQTS